MPSPRLSQAASGRVKANHLDESLKQKSTVPRIFLKILEANLNPRKICES